MTAKQEKQKNANVDRVFHEVKKNHRVGITPWLTFLIGRSEYYKKTILDSNLKIQTKAYFLLIQTIQSILTIIYLYIYVCVLRM